MLNWRGVIVHDIHSRVGSICNVRRDFYPRDAIYFHFVTNIPIKTPLLEGVHSLQFTVHIARGKEVLVILENVSLEVSYINNHYE